MNYPGRLSLALVVVATPPAFSAAKDQELPDKEMLKMIEFLREMELLKQIDMMRDFGRLSGGANQAQNSAAPKTTPVPKKETPK